MDDKEKLKLIRKMVDVQAEDEGLWCIPDRIAEAYLQHKLRELHALIEDLTNENAV